MAKVFQRLGLMKVQESEQIRLAEHLKALKVEGSSEDSEKSFEFYQSHAIRWMMKKIKVAPSETKDVFDTIFGFKMNDIVQHVPKLGFKPWTFAATNYKINF
jgi:hypothetical protein